MSTSVCLSCFVLGRRLFPVLCCPVRGWLATGAWPLYFCLLGVCPKLSFLRLLGISRVAVIIEVHVACRVGTTNNWRKKQSQGG